ncbi:hypothetical protein, partial [Aquimarina sp. RZ0]|uniref:hypothetical protein n=1 Tax=Aquimarina sp. RZ0 TaxID=2607730 RepID=UPI001CB736BC
MNKRDKTARLAGLLYLILIICGIINLMGTSINWFLKIFYIYSAIFLLSKMIVIFSFQLDFV